MLREIDNTSTFEITNGKLGKIRYIDGDRKIHAIYEGNTETFRSKRELIEKIGRLTGNDFEINPIVTEIALNSVSEIGELCFAIANPEPLFATSQVAFDILIKSETAGLLFSGSEVILIYPEENLGSNIALNQNVAVSKEIVSEDDEYVLSVEDLTPNKLKIKLGTDCRNKEAFYVLGEEYEKLLRVIVNVQNWGNSPSSSVLNIENFNYEGNAQFFSEERGCVDFEKFCTRGGVHFNQCIVESIDVAPFGAGIGQIITITGDEFGSGIGGQIRIPNPDDGGVTDMAISGIDFNYIQNWSNDQIQILASSIGPVGGDMAPPFGSGTWEINPDVTQGTLMSCYTTVEIDYALINDNSLGVDKMIGLVFNPNISPTGTYQWYLDRDIDTDPVLMEKGITFDMVEDVAKMAYCDWEAATGIDFEYMGGIVNGNLVSDDRSVVQFNPIVELGKTTVRFTEGFCEDDDVFAGRFDEADIELRTDVDWFVSTDVNIGDVAGTQTDLYSVLIHEIGHSILLGHAMDIDLLNGSLDDRIMYFGLQPEQIKRDIDNKTVTGTSLLIQRCQDAFVPGRCFTGGFDLAINGADCTTPIHDISIKGCDILVRGNLIGKGDLLSISAVENLDYCQLVGVNGKVFFNKNNLVNGEFVIPTDDLPRGLYFIRASCSEQIFVKKIVIQ